MKNIIFFVSSMHTGGSERVAALLCNRWAAQGHNVTLVPTFTGRGTCEYTLDERIDLIYLADRAGTLGRTPIAIWRRFWAMRQLVRQTNADVVLSFLSNVNVAAVLATLGLNVPVVVSERIYPPAIWLGHLWSRLRQQTYPLAQNVIMQTEDGLDWLSQQIPKANGIIIPNPCIFPLPMSEPKLDPEKTVPSSRRLLLAVGRLAPQKQFDTAIEAFASLAPQLTDWDLAIVGEGPERAALEAQTKALGLSNRIHLPGRAGNLGDWYERADLFLMTSKFEGFPNVLLEALAHSLPAVSFDCPTGPSALIRNDANGFLVPPSAGRDGLLAPITKLMADPALRETFAKQAANVRNEYSFEKIGAEWDQALGIDS